MLATYSGSKAFLATFSSALAEEVKKDNIVVEHINTYFVVSFTALSLIYSFVTRAKGLETLQNPQVLPFNPFTQNLCSRMLIKAGFGLWCCV